VKKIQGKEYKENWTKGGENGNETFIKLLRGMGRAQIQTRGFKGCLQMPGGKKKKRREREGVLYDPRRGKHHKGLW